MVDVVSRLSLSDIDAVERDVGGWFLGSLPGYHLILVQEAIHIGHTIQTRHVTQFRHSTHTQIQFSNTTQTIHDGHNVQA